MTPLLELLFAGTLTLGLGALGILVLPWTDAELAESAGAWGTLARLPWALLSRLWVAS